MRKQLVIAALAAGTFLAPLYSAGQSDNPWYGTWNLSVSKSNYCPGPLPISTTTKIEPWDGDGLKYTVDVVTADGEERHIQWSAKFDRRQNPVTGNPFVDTNAVRRINNHTYEVTARKDGKITTVTRNVISRDGKTRTAIAIGKNAQLTQGPSKNVAVFERQ